MENEPTTAADRGADAALRRYLSEYYGRRLERTEDLERQACCADDTRSRYRDIVQLLPEDVTQRNYGCGCSLASW